MPQQTNHALAIAVTFTFISGGVIPLVVSLLEIIRNNMFAAVTFATVSPDTLQLHSMQLSISVCMLSSAGTSIICYCVLTGVVEAHC